MKTPAILIAILFLLAHPAAHAQLVVEDVASIAQDAVNEVVNLAEYVDMVENQVQQIETLTQELQQTEAYVKAFGNPAQLTSITGADDLVSGFQQSGVGQTLATLQQTASGVESLKNTANGLYQRIPDISLSGITVPRDADNYKPFAAIENTTSNYAAVYDDVMQRKQALQSDMADTINRLQSSSTDAETQKLQGVIAGQAAQLQALDREISNATSQAVVQDISNRNNEQKQQQARDEDMAADRADAFQKFGTMMLPDVNSDLRFGNGDKQ